MRGIWTHKNILYCLLLNLIWANMPQQFQDPLVKWKSIDKSTNTAELTHCTSNVEAGVLSLINLNSSFLLRQKKKSTLQLYFLQTREPYLKNKSNWSYIIYVCKKWSVLNKCLEPHYMVSPCYGKEGNNVYLVEKTSLFLCYKRNNLLCIQFLLLEIINYCLYNIVSDGFVCVTWKCLWCLTYNRTKQHTQ